MESINVFMALKVSIGLIVIHFITDYSPQTSQSTHSSFYDILLIHFYLKMLSSGL